MMKGKMLVAMAVSSLFAASLVYAAPSANDNMGAAQQPLAAPAQVDNNGMSGSSSISGASAMDDSSGLSSTNSLSGVSAMSGAAPVTTDEGGADTATGDDY